MKKLEILYQDDTCLVLNKPAGLAVQGGAGVRESVDTRLQAEYGAAAERRFLLVHRLDKDTSGVLLTARGAENAAFYAGCIAGRQAVKRYIAVCRDGGMLAGRGRITLGLETRGKRRDACTRYRILERFSADEAALPVAVLELTLETGRMHQIRRHLQQSGCPILGDDKYGDFPLNRRLRKTHGLCRLLLHAAQLALPRKNGGLLDISAPLPLDFERWLTALRSSFSPEKR